MPGRDNPILDFEEFWRELNSELSLPQEHEWNLPINHGDFKLMMRAMFYYIERELSSRIQSLEHIERERE